MHLYKRKVQHYETDKMGIIYHTKFVKCMEKASFVLFEDIKLSLKYVKITGTLSHVIGLFINYKKLSD